MRANDRGIVLLEVLVALVILTVTAGALTGAVTTLLQAEVAARAAERDFLAEDRLLTGLTLLTRDELEVRLGSRQLGAYEVRIERTRASLYRIGVRAAERPVAEELVTVIRRPEMARP